MDPVYNDPRKPMAFHGFTSIVTKMTVTFQSQVLLAESCVGKHSGCGGFSQGILPKNSALYTPYTPWKINKEHTYWRFGR